MGTEKRHVIYDAKHKVSDENHLSSTCFTVGSDVEMRDIPLTGEQYLLKVIKEREKCALITVCDKDITQYAKNQSHFCKEPPGAKVAPIKLKPTIEWQNIQISDFTDVRTYLTDLIVLNSKKGTWCHKVKTIVVEDDTLEWWKIYFQDNGPSLSCALGLNVELLNRGLEMLIEILKEIPPGQTVDHKTGQWIYTFLARVWVPPLSETVSVLRDLARTCADIRSNINQEDEDAVLKAAPLNLFICIVARYFKQFDLAD